jgi:hypothetical protein
MLEHYFILAFLAGLVNKLHDDLSDNTLLASFKTPVVMELLKGIHYVLFTALSLQKPVFFMILFAMFGCSSLADPGAWTGAYETAVPFSLGLIYLLLDYSQLSVLSFYDLFILPAILSTNIIEPLVLPQEFSILKFIVRIHILGALLCIILLPMFSDTVKYISMYYTGYFLCSVLSQYYCLMKTKKRLFKKKRSRATRKRK